jgi:hypothetical protein
MLARKLRSREREHVQAVRARPLQEVFDEGEERLLCPLQILEYEHRRVLLGEPFEEEPPRGESCRSVSTR